MLSLQQVTRRYEGAEGGVVAIDGLSLDIHAGEFVAIVGPSGCGKSTLLNILGCLDRPTSGRYLIRGRDVGVLDADERAVVRRQHLGFVFQRYNLLARLTALENVQLPALYHGLGKAERRRKALALLASMGLEARTGHRPNELSGGQQQRVSVARALINGADILLADEPTGALDSRTGHALLELLRDCAGAGTTVIVVTHDPLVAAATSRRIELRDGRVVSDVRQPTSEAGRVPAPDGGNPLGGAGADRRATRACLSRSDWWAAMLDAGKSAVSAIRSNRLRSALTTLGIGIGICSVVVTVALGEGVHAALEESFGAMVRNMIAVRRGTFEGDPKAAAIVTMRREDIDALRRLPEVIGVIPTITVPKGLIRRGARSSQVWVEGVDADGVKLDTTPVRVGRDIRPDDVIRSRDVVVLSERARARLFEPGENPLGQTVLLGDSVLTVVGVARQPVGIAAEFSVPGARAWLPYSTAATHLAGKPWFDGFDIHLRSSADPALVGGHIVTTLEKLHGGRDFTTFNAAGEWSMVEQTLGQQTLVLSLIAGITLVVGGIGVMNIMLVSVVERTHEVGIRMAIGARPADIGRQFLAESVALCLLGGLGGLLLAFLACTVLQHFQPELPIRVSLFSASVACAICTAIGVGFGWMPARRAAQLDPVIALARE